MYIGDYFYAVATGLKVSRRLGLQNFGSKEVTILGAARMSGDRELAVQLPLPLVLAVGDVPELQLTEFFEPSTELGEKSTQIVLRTDAEDLPFIEIELKGTAVAR
jgi:hypothetical protein